MLKRALRAGSAVSTLVASAMAPGVNQSTPTAASPQKRRAAERQARVCGPSAARKACTGAAQRCKEGYLVFVTVEDVAIQTFGKETFKSMSTTLMFFNCCQCACETFASKDTP